MNILRIFRNTLGVMSCCLVLMGCPMATDSPLILRSDAAAIAIDMEGTWVPDVDSIAGAERAVIKRTGESTYTILRFPQELYSSGVPTKYSAWTGVFKGQPHIVLEEEGGADTGRINFLFYRVESPDPNTLITYNPEGTAALLNVFERMVDKVVADTSAGFTMDALQMLDVSEEKNTQVERVVWRRPQ